MNKLTNKLKFLFVSNIILIPSVLTISCYKTIQIKLIKNLITMIIQIMIKIKMIKQIKIRIKVIQIIK